MTSKYPWLIMKKLFLLIMVFLLVGSCKNSSILPLISSQLSFNNNPADHWQIGYSKDNTLILNQFQLSTSADTSNIIGMWHPFSGSAGYYPYIGQNRASTTKAEPTNGWAARAGQIAMEGSNSGQYSLLRFVTPSSGKYKVSAVFEGLHFGLSTTDVHILLNSNPIFSELIDGYGGDSAFHKIEGANPTASFHDILSLNESDVLTFAVGFGANKNHTCDTTGLLVSIEIQ